MSKAKKLLLSVLSLAVACFISFGVSTVNSFAAEKLSGFDVTGASIRVVEPYGLRFHTQVPDGEKANYTFGTLIIPKAELGNNELTYETTNAVKVTANTWQSDTEYTVVLGGKVDGDSITSFPTSQFNSVILARSYALDGTGAVVYYTDVIERTYAGVASKGLAVTIGDNVVTNPDTLATLNGIVDSVLGDDGFALANDTITLEVGSSEVAIDSLLIGSEGLTAKVEIANGDCLTVTQDAYGIVSAIKAKSAGTATLTITIGSYTKTLTVVVNERAVAANEVIDYKYASDVVNTAQQNAVSLSYLDTFEGANGVMKIEQSDWWARWQIKPLQDVAVYSNYKYLVIRMWVESATKAPDNYIYIGRRSADQLDCKTYNTVETGRWVDYYFSAKSFVEQWSEGWNSYYSAIVHARTSTCYVDKIFVTNNYLPDAVEVNYFDTAPTGVTTIGGSSTEYLPEFQGATGVLKVVAPNWSITYFPAVRSIHDYAGYTHVVMRVWADTTTCGMNLNNDGDDYAINIKKASVANQWYDYYFTFEDFKQAWSRGDSYKGLMMFNSGGTIYIDAVYMVNVPVNDNKVLTFDSEIEAGHLCGKGAADAYGKVEWLDEYMGKYGVAKLTYTSVGSKWQSFNFKPVKPVSDYADYTHIVIRARVIKETEGATLYVQNGLYFGSNTGCDKQPIGYEGWTYDNAWREYKFEIAPFLAAWSNEGSTAIGSKDNIWFRAADTTGEKEAPNGTGYIYIDEIYCVKEA